MFVHLSDVMRYYCVIYEFTSILVIVCPRMYEYIAVYSIACSLFQCLRVLLQLCPKICQGTCIYTYVPYGRAASGYLRVCSTSTSIFVRPLCYMITLQEMKMLRGVHPHGPAAPAST